MTSVDPVRTLVAVWLLLGAAPARGQTFTYLSDPVLEASDVTGWPSTVLAVGAPAVAYDSIRERFVMVFEARTNVSNVNCPQGVWALGLATSTDGVSWTVSTNPLVRPTPSGGNYYSCVAAHPAAVFYASGNGGNGQLFVLFKAEESEAACPTSPYTSCPYTGLGRVRVDFDASGNVSGSPSISSSPVLTLDGPGGHPSFVRDESSSTFRMLYQRYPDVYRTTSTNINSFSTGTLTFSTGSTEESWIFDEFKSPSVICDDSVAFPFAAWVGSVDTNFGAVVDGAWGKAISATGASWDLATDPVETWTDDDDWRHWDLLRLITGDYLIWYSSRASGSSAIYFGGTPSGLVFNNADVQGRNCP